MEIKFESLEELDSFFAWVKSKAEKPEPKKPIKLDNPRKTKKGLLDHGFPVGWQDIVNDFIEKNQEFSMKDLIGDGQRNQNHCSDFKKWLDDKIEKKEMNIKVEKRGLAYVFAPFKEENGKIVYGIGKPMKGEPLKLSSNKGLPVQKIEAARNREDYRLVASIGQPGIVLDKRFQ